ncbi:unnamed protein product [marine sediment metagenome]|uniref:Uncharacterized protein n=1 Tax=marine sediment metagenome TaxID=412755 RepID=X1M1M8_9ZZZZ
MVDEETKEKVWNPGFPKCPKCGYPEAQPPKCISCGQKLVEAEEPEKPEEPETPEGGTPEGEKPEEPELDELLKKTRDELNALAEEKGLNSGDYHNKEEIAKAISEKESE